MEKSEEDVLTLGWRAKVELDQKELLTSMLELQPPEQTKEESQGEE